MTRQQDPLLDLCGPHRSLTPSQHILCNRINLNLRAVSYVLPRDAEAQAPAARAARSRLQLARSAYSRLAARCAIRDEIREEGRRLSLEDTQPGCYGRLYSRRRLCARRSADAESSFDLVELVRFREQIKGIMRCSFIHEVTNQKYAEAGSLY